MTEPDEAQLPEEEKVAEDKASEAVGIVALQDLERQYFLSIDERESYKRRLGDTEEERNTLQQELAKLQVAHKKLTANSHDSELLEEKFKTVESKYADGQERMDRMQLENDKLREEISQLNTKNSEMTKQLASEQIKSKLQESEAIPLFHEKERLQTELDSVQSHASWLQQELEAKQKDCQHVQTQSRDRILQLQFQLNQTTDELAEAQTKLSILEKVENDLQKKLLQITKDNMDLKTELQEAEVATNMDLQDLRRICDLQKEHIARWKKRCDDMQKENEDLQKTAQKALEAGDDEMEKVRNDLKTKYMALMQEQKDYYETKLQSQISDANQNIAAITLGATSPAARGDEEDGPFEMTELLQRWEETKRALRTERWYHDRTKRVYNKLVKEVRDKTPLMARQREEFEMAIERNEALEKRLKSALQEKDYALADATDAQNEMSRLANQLKRREEEAKTLARQVQALLVKQSGGEPTGEVPLSIQEIQNQNMQLLEEQRRLCQQVEDLEGRLSSDTLRSELDNKSKEVAKLVQERERQEKLVEQIVQQRDLYRALVNRHDNEALGSESEELSMIDTVQKQSTKLQSLEKNYRTLEDNILQAKNELENAIREKDMFQERFKRYEHANAELTSAVDTLQKELLDAKGESAKSAVDASYHKEKCTRLEESLERSRGEIMQLKQSRAEIQQNVASIESVLSKVTTEQGRLVAENRMYESKLRALETRLETEKATAERYARDNGQLREDIARQGAMIDHIRRIENSISAKNETEMGQLKEQLNSAKEKIATLERDHSSESTEISNKLADSQSMIETLRTNLSNTQQESIEAKKESLEAKTELQTVKSQVRKLEGQLRAAKKKLGEETDVDNVELELQLKIDNLESDLSRAKEEIEALREEAETYRSLAKSGEAELSKTKKAAETFKIELQEEVNDLKSQVEHRKKEFESRSNLLRDVTSDLANQRDEREQIEKVLKAEIQSLKDKIASDEAIVSSTKDSFEAYKADIERYRKEVSEALQNYERELAKHAEARTSLRTAQETAVEHQRTREETENRLQTLKKEIESEKQTFVTERGNLSNQISSMEKRVEEYRGQNKLLHTQLESLNSSIEKSKESKEIRDDEEEAPESEQQKTIAELREIIRYLRSENEVCQTDLDAARRAIDREKAATEVLRRSLEEVRSELRSAQQQGTGDSHSSSEEELRRQLDDKMHQLRVLNDSNRLLREDTERLTQKLKKAAEELTAAKTTTQPVEDIKRELGDRIKHFETENVSLRRELDLWKSRMNNLVKNLDQIDPEEHRKLIAQVEDMTKEKESLNAWKVATESENKRIRGIATRMKKLNEDHQATIESQKKVISSLQEEKENLRKESTVTNTLTKERDDLKTKILQIEKEKSAIKTELEGANNSADRLRESLRRFKEKINSLENELALLKTSATVAAIPAAPTAPTAQATNDKTTAKLSPKLTNAPSPIVPPPDIPKIPAGGFKFGPSANQNQPSSDSSIELPLALSTDGQEGTKPSNPAPTETVKEIVKRRLSGENKEMSMKEKLLMKKKRLEQEVLEGLKRKQALDEAETAKKRSKTSGDNNDTITDAKLDESQTSFVAFSTTQSTAEGKGTESATLEKGTLVGDNASSALGIPVFGQSKNHGLRPSAPDFTPGQSQVAPPPSVAASSSSSSSTAASPFGKSEDNVFLNLKPPGSSGSIPSFSFGSKANIILPTPSLTQTPSPFSSEFRRQSSGLGAAKPLFGGGTSAPAEETTSESKGDEGEAQIKE